MAEQTPKTSGLQVQGLRALSRIRHQGWCMVGMAYTQPSDSTCNWCPLAVMPQTSLHTVVTVVGGVRLEDDSGKTKHGAQKSCVGPRARGPGKSIQASGSCFWANVFPTGELGKGECCLLRRCPLVGR